MSNIETGGPAFPTEVWDAEGIPQHTEGMTLRDYFAAKAISSMLAPNPVTGQFALISDFEDCAINAYKMADAMMKARAA